MTTQNKNIGSVHNVVINGETFEAFRLKFLSEDGNPQYVVHYSTLGIKSADYGKIKGITKYRGKWFGGGVKVVDCYNIQQDVNHLVEVVKHFYNPLEANPNEKQVQAMERLANRIERESNGGLAGAFMSSSYHGHDSYCMIVNTSEYQNKGGYVVYNSFEGKAVFIGDNE